MKLNLDECFARITEHWRPKVLASLNGQEVRLVKVLGEFPWRVKVGEKVIADRMLTPAFALRSGKQVLADSPLIPPAALLAA